MKIFASVILFTSVHLLCYPCSIIYGAGQKPEVSGNVVMDFKNVSVGACPKNWSADYTGQGTMPEWKVVNNEGKNVIAQLSSDQPENHFNLFIWDKEQYQDVSLEVKFKAMEGTEDRGGGLVWRYIDRDNYYIARANPLENNFRIYKVVNGDRRMLASAGIDMQSGVWITLSITMKGNLIEGYYNGKKYLNANDSAFTKPGKIGLWTKSDAVTYFNELKITPL